MALSDRLAPKQPTFASRLRTPAPKGWEPGVRFDSDNVQFITSDVLPTLEGEPDWRSAIENMGVTIPDGYRVRIAEMKFDPMAWGRDDPEQKFATTRPLWRYRFVVEPIPNSEIDPVDGIEILNAIKRSPKPRRQMSGSGSMILNLNDTQIGKDAGGGTPATLERLDRFFDLARDRIRDVRKQVGDLVILLGGDLVEGCNIYPNQHFEIDLDRRAQIRTTTGIVLDMLDRFAPEFPTVRVLAVPGNHGEHRQNGRRINRHDNDDQLVAESAALAAERDDKLSHVAFNIAYDQPALTADIQGHILGVTHGSIYGKTAGTPSQKAFNWYKNMAASRNPIGDCDILVGNHFHHDLIANYGTLLFVQNPAMDGGSPFFAELFGSDCEPGMSTWIMNEQSRMTGYEVLR